MTQPEALRLADLLEQIDGQHWQVQDSAAAELRRLHQLALDQQGEIYALKMARSMEQKTAALKANELERCKHVCDATSEGWRADAEAWEAQRDALLDALRSLLSYANVLEMRLLDADGEHRAMQQARAAIATVERTPAWCEIHQHHKWCEHNGGKMGSTGWEAP